MHWRGQQLHNHPAWLDWALVFIAAIFVGGASFLAVAIALSLR